MKTWTMTVVMAWACAALGCAVNTDPSGQDQSAATPDVDPKPAGPVLTPACERLDDLGLAAAGEPLRLGNPSALDGVCVGIESGALSSVAGTSCKLVEPLGFSLVGCADWYDCGGCIMRLRHDSKLDEWTLEGVSPEGTCAAFDAKYFLMPGPTCGSHEGPVTQ
ncbi:MAG: hypothetical protein HYZ29_15095 [Myxococcales bacterium]|nr:hypothetical protein [Myxococcales bacterium]